MKKIISILAVCLAILAIAEGCKKTEPVIEDDYISIEGQTSFKVDKEEVILKVNITSNCKWVVTKTDANGNPVDWVKVNMLDGSGNKELQIKVLKNETTEKRSASVNVESDNAKAYVDIEQAKGEKPAPVKKYYQMPVYQMFETSGGLDVPSEEIRTLDVDFTNATVEGNVIKFDDGLEIEKTGAPGAFKMAYPCHTNPGAMAGFQLGICSETFSAGESWIFKIPLQGAVSGQVRFSYGSRKESISDKSAYAWSIDGGTSWNEVDKMESVKSDAAFKSVWLTIPAGAITVKGELWIRITPTKSTVYLQNGMTLDYVKEETTPAPTGDGILLFESFDNTCGVNASYVEVPGFMKSMCSGYTTGATADTNPYAPANEALSVLHCFARPGFLQIGYNDEALKARCGWNGQLKIDASKLISEKTDLEISFKASGMTNAYRNATDAAIVICDGEGNVLAEAKALQADKWNDYKLTVKDVTTSTTLVITSKTCEKPSDGSADQPYKSADYRFFVDDLCVRVAGSAPAEPIVLDFDFSSLPAGWPDNGNDVIYKDTDVSPRTQQYFLEGVPYDFILAPCPDASSRGICWGYTAAGDMMFMQVHRYLGLPVIEGYKLTKVTLRMSAASNDGRKVGVSPQVVGSKETKVFVPGGEPVVVGTQGEEYSFNLTASEPGTLYYLVVSAKAVGFDRLVLTYNQ